MKESDSIRLARMEERQINHGNMLADFINKQSEHNEKFYESRHKLIAMEAKQEGAWKTVGVFGTLTIGVAGFVSWLITTFMGK